MREWTLQVCENTAAPVLCHGPRAEDLMKNAKNVLLCGECRIILIRTDDERAGGDFVVICDNCGAINTDLSHI